jgi:hypothetical protein
MGKTKRNASRWMETCFKLGNPRFPKDNVKLFDGRYQNKMRNKNHSYYSTKIDPLSYKVISWKECGNWAKSDARKAARHNAKLLVKEFINETFIEEMMDLSEQLIDDDWYHQDMMGFGFGFDYFDEAYDYSERRHQEKQENDRLNYRYDPCMYWEY